MQTRLEASFVDRGTHYKVNLSILEADQFQVTLVDEDVPERWNSSFTAKGIEEMTYKTGNRKTANIFWRLLQDAITGQSTNASINVYCYSEINSTFNLSEKANSTRPEGDISKIILILSYTENSLEIRKYPLILQHHPFSEYELKSMIRDLRAENENLKNTKQQNNQNDIVHTLEAQLFDLNKTLTNVTTEKDVVILKLRKKLSDLEDNLANQRKPIRTRLNPISNPPRVSNARPLAERQPISRRQPVRKQSTENSKNSSRKPSASRGPAPARYQSGSQRSSAANSRRSSVNNSSASSRRSSVASSRNNSANSSARSSSRNSSNSRFSNGYVFNPTEWVKKKNSAQSSKNSSRNSSRNPSPAIWRKQPNSKTPQERQRYGGYDDKGQNLQRLRKMVQQKY